MAIEPENTPKPLANGTNVSGGDRLGEPATEVKTWTGLVVRPAGTTGIPGAPAQHLLTDDTVGTDCADEDSFQAERCDVGESVHSLLEWHLEHLQEKTSLSTLDLKTACHIILFCVAVALAISNLQLVIIPLIFAGFFAVTLEPVAFIMLDLGTPLCNNKSTLRNTGTRAPVVMSPSPVVGHGDGNKHHLDSDSDSDQEGRMDTGAQVVFRPVCDVIVLSMVRRMWIVIIVWSCIVGLLSVFVAIVVAVIGSFQSVPWEKYLESERVQGLMAYAKDGGVDLKELGPTILPWLIQGALWQIMDHMWNMISGLILMLLFLCYWLIHNLTERLQEKFGSARADNELNLQKKLERSMRMYIIQKTYLSLLKAVLVGLMFFFLQVDLWFIWALLTFVLNFIPLGSAVATILPVIFVIFDPTKSWTDVIICAAVPVAIHNIVGNLIEPKMFADSLNLHPITVLLSLAFWSVVWGVFGALLSVPLSSALRIVLLEMHEHPYCLPIVKLMEAKHVPPKAHLRQYRRDRGPDGDDLSSPTSIRSKETF